MLYFVSYLKHEERYGLSHKWHAYGYHTAHHRRSDQVLMKWGESAVVYWQIYPLRGSVPLEISQHTFTPHQGHQRSKEHHTPQALACTPNKLHSPVGQPKQPNHRSVYLYVEYTPLAFRRSTCCRVEWTELHHAILFIVLFFYCTILQAIHAIYSLFSLNSSQSTIQARYIEDTYYSCLAKLINITHEWAKKSSTVHAKPNVAYIQFNQIWLKT